MKILRKALKHARPPRGALTPRHLPDVLPDETPPSYMRRKDDLDGTPMPTHTVNKWIEEIAAKYGGKVQVDNKLKAQIELGRRKVRALFKSVSDTEAHILLRADATLYELLHEMKHADHWKEIRHRAFAALDNWKKEFETFKRLKAEDWKKLTDLEKKDAIQYIYDTCKKETGSVPHEVMDAITEWEAATEKLFADP